MLDSRKEKITSDLREADENKKAAIKLQKESEEILRKAKIEANEILKTAEKKADERRESILNEAKTQREKIIKTYYSIYFRNWNFYFLSNKFLYFFWNISKYFLCLMKYYN